MKKDKHSTENEAIQSMSGNSKAYASRSNDLSTPGYKGPEIPRFVNNKSPTKFDAVTPVMKQRTKGKGTDTNVLVHLTSSGGPEGLSSTPTVTALKNSAEIMVDNQMPDGADKML